MRRTGTVAAPEAAAGPAPGAAADTAGFPHLHVASGFSMRYGTTMPEQLVERAAELGQSHLALTDRDGTYGAVRFARACQQAGVTPVPALSLIHI